MFGFRYGLDRPRNLAGEPEFPAGCRGSVDVSAPGRGNQSVKTLSEKFYHSQIVLEVVTEKYTHGVWKSIVILRRETRARIRRRISVRFWRPARGGAETYGKGIKVIDEWSYIEDPDVRPTLYKYMGLNRTQSTVRQLSMKTGEDYARIRNETQLYHPVSCLARIGFLLVQNPTAPNEHPLIVPLYP